MISEAEIRKLLEEAEEMLEDSQAAFKELKEIETPIRHFLNGEIAAYKTILEIK